MERRELTTLDGKSHLPHAPTRARPKLPAINNRETWAGATRVPRRQDRMPVCATNGVDCTVCGDLLPLPDNSPASLAISASFCTSTIANSSDVFCHLFALIIPVDSELEANSNNKAVTFTHTGAEGGMPPEFPNFQRTPQFTY